MPEVLEQPITESLGWRAGLTGDLQQNEAFKEFKTVADFGKRYLEVQTKATELEGKLSTAVPKLGDNATDAERSQYYDALGRPKQPSEYEFDGEDKNAPEWTSSWKQQFHSMGFTKAQGKQLSTAFNAQMQKMVEAHNVSIKNEVTAAETKLKSEWGDKYDANVELARRLYQKHVGTEFDKDFDAGTEKTRLATIRLLVKFAALTGEDRSPQAGQSQNAKTNGSFINYDKSPAPPKRV
jgi:hypothetical protein